MPVRPEQQRIITDRDGRLQAGTYTMRLICAPRPCSFSSMHS